MVASRRTVPDDPDPDPLPLLDRILGKAAADEFRRLKREEAQAEERILELRILAEERCG